MYAPYFSSGYGGTFSAFPKSFLPSAPPSLSPSIYLSLPRSTAVQHAQPQPAHHSQPPHPHTTPTRLPLPTLPINAFNPIPLRLLQTDPTPHPSTSPTDPPTLSPVHTSKPDRQTTPLDNPRCPSTHRRASSAPYNERLRGCITVSRAFGDRVGRSSQGASVPPPLLCDIIITPFYALPFQGESLLRKSGAVFALKGAHRILVAFRVTRDMHGHAGKSDPLSVSSRASCSALLDGLLEQGEMLVVFLWMGLSTVTGGQLNNGRSAAQTGCAIGGDAYEWTSGTKEK
ncbi:hypothetical protein DFP72DRAFT_843113 [Ephemerocybe angulata]|uniref:Uncharacterized protein n=1 Tax=Ephemerocybe angulata TaxID=980116 RepID=A0A8H6IAZ0_9AGAR|nr:hypothetical protein DFP72DRAFT_843113 [Tulosesus angulatus]